MYSATLGTACLAMLTALSLSGCTAIVDPFPDCEEREACGAYACADDGIACKAQCVTDLDCGNSAICAADETPATSDDRPGACTIGACQSVVHRELLSIFAGESSTVDTFATGDFNVTVARTSLGSWAMFTRISETGTVDSVTIDRLVDDGAIRLAIVPRTGSERPGFYWVQLSQAAPVVQLTELLDGAEVDSAEELSTTIVADLNTSASIVGLDAVEFDDTQVLIVPTTGGATSLVSPATNDVPANVQRLEDSGFTITDAAAFEENDEPGVIYTRNNIARWETVFAPISKDAAIGATRILRDGEGDDVPRLTVRQLDGTWYGTDDSPALPNSNYRSIAPTDDAFYGDASFAGTAGFTDSRIYDADQSFTASFGELGLVDDGAGTSMRFRYALGDAGDSEGWTRVATARDQRTSLVDGSLSREANSVDTVWLEWVREAGAVVYLSRWNCAD